MPSLDRLCWNYLERNEANRDIKLVILVPTQVWKSLHVAPRLSRCYAGDSQINSLPLKSCMEIKFLKPNTLLIQQKVESFCC